MDGLENYYTADGSLIGKIGNNTQVRVVNDYNIKTVLFWINAANNPPEEHDEGYTNRATQYANQYSHDIGMTNDELNIRATLSTLKQTEAGELNKPLDYNAWNEGYNFTEKTYEEEPEAYKEHPGANPNSKHPKGRTSAGAYQFLKRFYTGGDFSPITQDKEAIKLMGKRGVSAAKSGDIIKIKEALSGKWTSLKFWPVDKLKSVFKKNLSEELNRKSKIAAPVGSFKDEKQ